MLLYPPFTNYRTVVEPFGEAGAFHFGRGGALSAKPTCRATADRASAEARSGETAGRLTTQFIFTIKKGSLC